jgi:hypothetical protein
MRVNAEGKSWFAASRRVVIHDQGLLSIVSQGLQRLTAGWLTSFMERRVRHLTDAALRSPSEIEIAKPAED